MARIRTIKPDFWTDETMVELDMAARLFFIGSWNFADDNGNLPRSPKKLKMQVFPADAIDVDPLIHSLIAHGLFAEYTVRGEKYLHIKGFRKHQVINRPSKTGLPTPEMADPNESLTDGSLTEGKGSGREVEGKGKEGNGEEQVVAVPTERHSDEPPAPPATVQPIETTRAVAISALLRRNGIEGCNGSNPIVLAWAADTRITDDMLLTAAEMAKNRNVTRPGPSYLEPIVKQLLTPPKPKSPPLHTLNDGQLSQAGRECGAGEARVGESRDSYIDRIKRKQAENSRGAAA
ncbi:hypothetical protein PIN31115_02063 [Pandoraea iniqua]|uniref:Uncharacterized protein n=1 Tax=Pandoraea iniqua TaxID=2508288 RepID=A0A5E4UM76_9BURK|nr:hypothetical protein [Pandoraea iniqua]VVE00189.1 hypothetical protein PIN31115_02063 [Pandoraea iniqua]